MGYAFTLVDPEELAYCLDVFGFLNLPSPADAEEPYEAYTLGDMTPQHTHLGAVPQDVIDEENGEVTLVLSLNRKQAVADGLTD